MTQVKIRRKERDAIIRSLQAGVTPNKGQQHIQVGRIHELKALINDLESIREGGCCFRLIIGEYGSGKTFFLNLVRALAMEKRLVTAHADLNPDRRLHATKGQARGLFRELMRNLSTRTKMDGGALSAVVERFIAATLNDANARSISPETAIRERLTNLQEMVGGYDFAEVIAAYWRGHDQGDDTLKANALRWLRAEFSTRTDARMALGVRTIIDDASVYDSLKLLARFFRMAGYDGFVVCTDEMVNLFKLTNSKARNANYEQILRILNDCLQGSVEGFGMLLGGTPEFLMDPRKGLYSYEALETRLAKNNFAKDGLVDFTGPVITLSNLTPEDLYTLLEKIRRVYFQTDESPEAFPDEAIPAFLKHCNRKIGDAYFKTPRNTIKAFISLLAVLSQNPGTRWSDLIDRIPLEKERVSALEQPSDEADDEDLVNLTL